MSLLYLDSETFCEEPITNGTHKYAETVEVMIVSWAIDDGPVKVHDRTNLGLNVPASGPLFPLEVYEALADPETIVVTHTKGGFDRLVFRAAGIDIPPERIHDTAIQAMAHGLPGGLDKLCSIFPVPEHLKKDKVGKELIRLFCKPLPKNQTLRRHTGMTLRDRWIEFLRYAGNDIEAMRWLYKNLPRWNYPTREHALWVLDQKINDRGFKVDQELAHGAIAAVELVKKDANAETKELTDGRLRSTQQRDKLLEELLLEFGVALPDLQSSTLEKRLEDPELPPEVKELIANRLMVSSTSTSKYNRILKGVSSDGRMRGTLQFCGAPRTKRWSGLMFQPQNLPRPDMEQEDIEIAVEAFRSGAGYWLLDDPMRAAWNCIRGLLIAEEGHKLVQADLSGIEARVLPWLAGEDWKLEAFHEYDRGIGPDQYIRTAGRLLGKPPEEVTKDERQAYGKVVELACGYGGAHGAFMQFAAVYGVEMTDGEIYDAVRGWREAHPAIADWDNGLWAKLDNAARQAIYNPGKVFEAGEHIAFEKWRNWMKMHLPSGGFLSYASPQVIEDPKRPGSTTVSFMGINNYTKRWERITTYGGKLSADATQATAREILAHNLPWIEENGFPIILQVHDEVVTEPLDDSNHSVSKLVELLTRRPPWINDKLPLAAGGFEAYRYRKD